jgi:hypothetical protein
MQGWWSTNSVDTAKIANIRLRLKWLLTVTSACQTLYSLLHKNYDYCSIRRLANFLNTAYLNGATTFVRMTLSRTGYHFCGHRLNVILPNAVILNVVAPNMNVDTFSNWFIVVTNSCSKETSLKLKQLLFDDKRWSDCYRGYILYNFQ